MGIGLIAFSLALLPFLLGAILALYGLKRFGPKQFWLALFTMGLVPALILAFDYFAADPETTWVPASYLYLTLFFGIIALVGLAFGLLEKRRASTRTNLSINQEENT